MPPRTMQRPAEPDAVPVSQDVLSRLKGDILDGHDAPGAWLAAHRDETTGTVLRHAPQFMPAP
ncbi:hypothetical protein [Falsiroseomonas stagni]|nr:hypothetical protein [Falsiroseomonas stagni]